MMWLIVGTVVFFLFGIGGFIEWRRKRINNHPHISTSSATRPGESQNYSMGSQENISGNINQ